MTSNGPPASAAMASLCNLCDPRDWAMALVAHLRALLRSALGIIPTLDLHGLGVQAALAETERFVRHAQAEGVRQVRIVYGKGHHSAGGSGVLRDVIPRWLERDGARYVESVQRQPDHSGADGGALVVLRSGRAAHLDNT